MKCFHCKKEIDESKGYEVTAPDGDWFHKECLPLFNTERDRFFKDVIKDDDKFNDWMDYPIKD